MRRTKNEGLIVGTLLEKDLQYDEVTIDVDGKKIKSDVIKGKISVQSDCGVHTIRVYSREKRADGEDNKLFSNFKALANEYTSRAELIKRHEDPDGADIIKVRCSLGINDYVGRDNALHTTMQITATIVSREKVEKADKTAEFAIEGYIKNIKTNDDGKVKIEIVGVGYKENAEVFEFDVAEDIADEIEDYYSKGETTTLYVELATEHIGGEAKKKSSGFGRKANISEGYDRVIYRVIGGDEPYDEDMEDKNGEPLMISASDAKKLIKERELTLKQIEAEGYQGSKTEPTESKPKSKGLGKKTDIEVEEEVDSIF